MKNKRLFRFHKGQLGESIKTTIVVKNLKNIELRVKEHFNSYGTDVEYVEIDQNSMYDGERLGDDWENTYYVIGYTKDAQFVAGMCNFYEGETTRSCLWKKYLWYSIYIMYVTAGICVFSIFLLCGFIGSIGKRIYKKYFKPLLDNVKYNCKLWD